MSEPSAIVQKLTEFLRTRKRTELERDHRKRGVDFVRRDYLEFCHPSVRGLRQDTIEVIAADIGVSAHEAKDDYLLRGGHMRKRRSVACMNSAPGDSLPRVERKAS